MISISFPTVRTLKIPTPHPVHQLKRDVTHGENNYARDRRRDGRVDIHYEDEIVNVNHVNEPPSICDGSVDRRVDRFSRTCAIMRNWRYKPTSNE